MQFGLTGISYKTARLDVRDQISFTDSKKLDFFQKAESAGVSQCMILSTCNRSEVYFFYENRQQFDQVCHFYGEMFPEISLADHLVRKTGEEAVAYLFRVTAGIESLVPGEDQILGQVKEALDFSRAMGYGGKELNRFVTDAIACAKRIKTELKISEKPLSVSYIGIRRLEESCGIAGKHVFVIGSGKTAALAVRYVYEYHAGQVTVCSRTLSHAAELRKEFADIHVTEYEKRYEVMAQCDIVISATSSPHLVVKREQFAPKRPVAFLDLAAPRDIDTAFAGEKLVELIDLDTLQRVAKDNQREREKLAIQSEEQIRGGVKETEEWLLKSRVDGTIRSLQQRCQEIVEDSCGYLERKIEMSQREKKLVEKVLRASLQRLLREPIQELKQIDSREEQDRYQEMVNQLFRI